MAKWLGDQGETLVDAFKGNWHRLPRWTIATATFLGLTYITQFLDRLGIYWTVEPVWPWWARATAVFFAIVTFVLLTYATKRRIETTPAYRLSFNQSTGIQQELAIAQHGPSMTQGNYSTQANYIRIAVEATSKATIRNCSASLKRIDYVPHQGGTPRAPFISAGMELGWTGGARSPIDISYGLPQAIDLARTIQISNHWEALVTNPSNNLPGYVDPAGKYIFHVHVVGSDVAQEIKIQISWFRQWNSIAAEIVD